MCHAVPFMFETVLCPVKLLTVMIEKNHKFKISGQYTILLKIVHLLPALHKLALCDVSNILLEFEVVCTVHHRTMCI